MDLGGGGVMNGNGINEISLKLMIIFQAHLSYISTAVQIVSIFELLMVLIPFFNGFLKLMLWKGIYLKY